MLENSFDQYHPRQHRAFPRPPLSSVPQLPFSYRSQHDQPPPPPPATLSRPALAPLYLIPSPLAQSSSSSSIRYLAPGTRATLFPSTKAHLPLNLHPNDSRNPSLSPPPSFRPSPPTTILLPSSASLPSPPQSLNHSHHPPVCPGLPASRSFPFPQVSCHRNPGIGPLAEGDRERSQSLCERERSLSREYLPPPLSRVGGERAWRDASRSGGAFPGRGGGEGEEEGGQAFSGPSVQRSFSREHEGSDGDRGRGEDLEIFSQGRDFDGSCTDNQHPYPPHASSVSSYPSQATPLISHHPPPLPSVASSSSSAFF